MPANHDMTPLLLIIDDQELSVRALEKVLRPKGYVLLKASTGQQALALASKVSPDTIVAARHLPDCDGIDLVRRLREEATVHATTPILVTAQEGLGKAERLDALGAGAWDIVEHPLDAPELILRLDTFICAKQETDRVRGEALTDPATGLYNVRGVLKRTKELNADSARTNRPLTCVAFGTQSTPERSVETLASERVSAALQAATRASDTVGCLSNGEFVVVAPDTDSEGASRLADRIVEKLVSQSAELGSTDDLAASMRAGFYSAPNTKESSAEDLLLRATMALRRAQQRDRSFRVRAHEA